MTIQAAEPLFDRVIWIVIDGVGCGEQPDAANYGDTGANTIGNLARELSERHSLTLKIPNMEAMGIGNLTPIEGVPPRRPGGGVGASGKALEKSAGKDTTSGHWELAGLVVSKPFRTFPDGFPQNAVDRWLSENNLPGMLWNRTASGTEIIEKFGKEHMATGKPILYTSADSVWQVAAHEETFGLDKLYAVCKSARVICDGLDISRVIARPFIGDPAKGIPFKRTYHRKDYSQHPFGKTCLDILAENGISTLGIGKIHSIFTGHGIAESVETAGNTDGIRAINEAMGGKKRGLIFCNLIDFDMLFGHRRDARGFAEALEEFDRAIPGFKSLMGPRDLLVVVADHGNDPTQAGSDHTREHIPVLAFSPAQKNGGPHDIGRRDSYADVGATVLHALLGREAAPDELAGKSFLELLGC